MNPNSLHLSRTTVVLLILGLIVLAAIAYTVLKPAPIEDTITISGDPVTSSEANFVTLASELDSIVFDITVLSDPRFTVLQNIHTAITPEPQGRTDPFRSF